jgi:hypothetical protein
MTGATYLNGARAASRYFTVRNEGGAAFHLSFRTPQHKGHLHPVLSRSTRDISGADHRRFPATELEARLHLALVEMQRPNHFNGSVPGIATLKAEGSVVNYREASCSLKRCGPGNCAYYGNCLFSGKNPPSQSVSEKCPHTCSRRRQEADFHREWARVRLLICRRLRFFRCALRLRAHGARERDPEISMAFLKK